MSFNISFSGHYLAIKNFRNWNNISGLTILTGHNGSGKSQLLRLIDTKINGMGPRGHDVVLEQASNSVAITGEVFAPREALLFEDNHNIGDGGSVNITDFHNTIQQMLNDLQNGARNHFQQHNPSLLALRSHIERTIRAKGINIKTLAVEEFKTLATDDWFVFDLSQIYRNLAQIFRKYHSGLSRKVMTKELTVDEAKRMWETESPWSELNTLLSKTTLGFTLTDCWNLEHEKPYALHFVTETGIEIKPHDLSAGEKAITKIILLTFIHNYKTAQLKLVLLDEQDAHLEPSAIDGFIDSIRNTLVEKFKCHVVLTTHRSETIALAPEECLFELKKNPSEVVKVQRDKVISKISRNLLKVWTEGQLVLVEAEDDQKFYSSHCAWLARDNKDIAEKRLNFISVAKRDGSGGASLVESHVEKMRGFTKGVLDSDNKASSPKNIFRIGRYSIENYYLDPHIVMSFLIAKNKLPVTEFSMNNQVTGARLADIQDLRQEDLQKFADWVYPKVLPFIKKDILKGDASFETIQYTNGKSLKVPKWILKTRGHDLIGSFKVALSCASLGIEELHHHAEFQNKMISTDLVDLFRAL